jgi:hypothetical protein
MPDRRRRSTDADASSLEFRRGRCRTAAGEEAFIPIDET